MGGRGGGRGGGGGRGNDYGGRGNRGGGGGAGGRVVVLTQSTPPPPPPPPPTTTKEKRGRARKDPLEDPSPKQERVVESKPAATDNGKPSKDKKGGKGKGNDEKMEVVSPKSKPAESTKSAKDNDIDVAAERSNSKPTKKEKA